MENETQNQKTCQNCKFYLQHYIKRATMYYALHSGHCVNRRNRTMAICESCGLWEDAAVKNEKRKQTIYECLKSMAKRVDEIAMILKDDM